LLAIAITDAILRASVKAALRVGCARFLPEILAACAALAALVEQEAHAGNVPSG